MLLPSPTTLARWFGRQALAPAAGGHTNDSFFVTADAGEFVLRRSWRGKPAAQLAREAAVLDALAGRQPVPRRLPTLDGALEVVDDERVLQLFSRCAGVAGERWLDAGDGPLMRAAMTRLARLHRSLASQPAEPGDPLHWLRVRYERVVHGGRWPRQLADSDVVLRQIERRLAVVDRAPCPLQWLHGDYHLGNLLWHEGDVAAVVDFDDCERGVAASEAALALFALSRRSDEARFQLDRALWNDGRAAYEAAGGSLGAYDDVDEMELLFCAYQVLIHIEAMLLGHWSLAPGIGFWPCWNRLTAWGT